MGINDIVLISAGRLDANKNNETTIRAVAKVSNVKLLLCGDGELKSKLKALAESLGVSDRILFLGNRTDIMDLYQAADIFVLMSFREGLSRSIMEAMASGLPCIVSRIRGNVDLVQNDINGFLCEASDYLECAENISKLSEQIELRVKFGEMNLQNIRHYGLSEITQQLKIIYGEQFC